MIRVTAKIGLLLGIGILSQSVFAANDSDQHSSRENHRNNTALLEQLAGTQQALDEHQLPKLVISWRCGDCVLDDKVAPLITKLYAKYAAKHGLEISDKESAEMDIVEFRQRNAGARIASGMAGADVLNTEVSFRDARFPVGDYAESWMFGMDSLCKSVAEKAAKQLSHFVTPQN